MEIKDLLKSGQTTPEQLMKDLQNQIDDAQKEIAAEEKAEQEKGKKEEYLKDRREELVNAAIDYLMAFNLIDPDTSDDALDGMCKETCKNLQSLEKAFNDFQPIRKDFEKILHDDLDWDWEWHGIGPDDAIIDTFIKSLRF